MALGDGGGNGGGNDGGRLTVAAHTIGNTVDILNECVSLCLI